MVKCVSETQNTKIDVTFFILRVMSSPNPTRCSMALYWDPSENRNFGKKEDHDPKIEFGESLTASKHFAMLN